jgi:manganese efflux pump family protein
VIDVVVLAFALAMDATAVAAARGVAGVTRGEALRIGVAFGAFQAGMAAIGWIAGRTAARAIEQWDHWVAFGLLALIGAKMIVEAIRGGDEDAARGALTWKMLLVLAVATSIDALAAGVTLPVLDAPAAIAIATIGVVTLVLSVVGALAGAAIGARGGRGLELAGGVALIGIGVKTLVEHLA